MCRHDDLFPEDWSEVDHSTLDRSYIIWIEEGIEVRSVFSVYLRYMYFMTCSVVLDLCVEVMEVHTHATVDGDDLYREFEYFREPDIFEIAIIDFS